MRKGGYFIRTILVFIIAFLIQLAGTVIVALVHGFMNGDGGSPMDWLSEATNLASDPDFTIYILLIYSILSIIIFGIWYRGRFIIPFRKMTRNYPSGFTLLTILTLVIAAFSIQFIGEALITLIGRIAPNLVQNYADLVSNIGIGESLAPLLLAYVVILGPIAEELIFRGLIYRFARLTFPFWLANIWQAALFGVFHQNVVQGIYAFIFGLILGYIAHRGHGIRYSIVAHIAANLLGMIAAGFFETLSGSFTWLTLFIGIVLAVFSMFVFSVEFHPLHKTKTLAERRGETS